MVRRIFRQGDFSCPVRVQRCLARMLGHPTKRCRRHTFRHPYCLQHARLLLGVDVQTGIAITVIHDRSGQPSPTPEAVSLLSGPFIRETSSRHTRVRRFRTSTICGHNAPELRRWCMPCRVLAAPSWMPPTYVASVPMPTSPIEGMHPPTLAGTRILLLHARLRFGERARFPDRVGCGGSALPPRARG